MNEFQGAMSAIKAIDNEIGRTDATKREIREDLKKLQEIQKGLKKKIKYLLKAKRHLLDLSAGLD